MLVLDLFVNGIFCMLFFFVGNTVNIFVKDTFSRYMGIFDRFIQVKTGQVKEIQGITRQKISNLEISSCPQNS